MNRFMGMMPRSEIRREQRFRDTLGLPITVQAGDGGWTVLWADHSSSYKDAEIGTEANWQEAMTHLAEHGFTDLQRDTDPVSDDGEIA